jgi:hypothetical protein
MTRPGLYLNDENAREPAWLCSQSSASHCGSRIDAIKVSCGSLHEVRDKINTSHYMKPIAAETPMEIRIPQCDSLTPMILLSDASGNIVAAPP